MLLVTQSSIIQYNIILGDPKFIRPKLSVDYGKDGSMAGVTERRRDGGVTLNS